MLHRRFGRGDTVTDVVIDLPGTILHRHFMSEQHAIMLLDWYVSTGGDQDRLPPPYKVLKPSPHASDFSAHLRSGVDVDASLTVPMLKKPADKPRPAPAPPKPIVEPIVEPVAEPVAPPKPLPVAAAPKRSGKAKATQPAGQDSLF